MVLLVVSPADLDFPEVRPLVLTCSLMSGPGVSSCWTSRSFATSCM